MEFLRNADATGSQTTLGAAGNSSTGERVEQLSGKSVHNGLLAFGGLTLAPGQEVAGAGEGSRNSGAANSEAAVNREATSWPRGYRIK